MKGFKISDPMLKRTMSFRLGFGSSPLDQLPRRSVNILRTPIEIPKASLEIPRTSSREENSQLYINRRIIRYKEINLPIYAENKENQEEILKVMKHAMLNPEMVKEIQKISQQRLIPF